jgi:hypothetical protein
MGLPGPLTLKYLPRAFVVFGVFLIVGCFAWR